ncbi:DUF4262 domain-containing protein [Flavisolibacter ginsenosidimutans]|uniref:DUF4262 domain-containing protein n=1 Tax=Flavisolibacter ginsenosidimutans TaxID=661481 RepID=A0A5B8ULP2_9BACT|nr:DUF4262 domain-containing protein [Flavisolibacter ginsenosidimutans]
MREQHKQDYFQQVDQNIRNHGYHITFVLADESPSYCYSTGIFKSFNIPEIFISSLPKNLSFDLVDSYVQLFKNAESIPLETKIPNLTSRFPVYLIEVPTPNLMDYALSSVRFYGSEEYKYLQIVYPDTKGNFPNEVGYNYDQEIMGIFKK